MESIFEEKRRAFLTTRKFLTIDKVLMVIGVLLFLFGAQLQTFTKTDINYSAYGGFLFVIGLVLFAISSPKKRRG